MTAPRATEDLRRIGVAATHIGVSKRTLYRAVQMGRIAVVKAGRNMTFVSMAQVQEWIAAGGNAKGVE